MKKVVFSSVALALSIASMTAFANENAVNQQALTPTQTTSVAKALKLADNSKVKIKAKVVKSLGNEEYQLKDATGLITVEIDDELWKNQAVKTGQELEVIGEIDIDHKPTKQVTIDADQINF